MNLSKTHPSRLMRLQEQLTTYQQQQQQAKRSAKTTTRSSASTNKKATERKVETPTSKKHHSAPVLPIDITTITKTQSLLNERMKTFDKIQTNQVTDLLFPNTTSKPTRRRSASHQRSRLTNHQDGQLPHLERLNSEKEKPRGPVYMQYSLTSGLKVKFSDGRPIVDMGPNGIGQVQPRDSVAYSFGSSND
jgi:ATPase subunit of ABC transporter with duplicated ATPase domains